MDLFFVGDGVRVKNNFVFGNENCKLIESEDPELTKKKEKKRLS